MATAKVSLETLSAVFRKQVQALKGSVTRLAKDYGIVREKISEVAPRAIKLFKQIQGEHLGFTLADFARLFDSDVPVNAADTDEGPGYRNNRTYQALAYMQRVVQQTENPRRGRQGKRDPATDQLARTVCTILQIVKASDHDAIWRAVAQEFRFGDRQLAGLKRRVETVKPIIDLAAVVKPVGIAASNIIHMEPIRPIAAAQPGTPAAALRAAGRGGRGRGAMAQPGRRVRRQEPLPEAIPA